jgi:hypothetical protein
LPPAPSNSAEATASRKVQPAAPGASEALLTTIGAATALAENTSEPRPVATSNMNSFLIRLPPT